MFFKLKIFYHKILPNVKIVTHVLCEKLKIFSEPKYFKIRIKSHSIIIKPKNIYDVFYMHLDKINLKSKFFNFERNYFSF